MIFSFSKFFLSLRRAIGALGTALREEQNFRVHVVAAIVAIFITLCLGVGSLGMAAVVGAVGIVLILELINSALERLVDMLQPRVHHYAGAVKNLMAAAVLLAAIVAVTVVLLIWWVHLVALWASVV
ncbi:MAG: diacylglycerol kinase family protein [Patescibacteria group bacterium]|nr:diacylglycerol kinase family protein [Patescibacteria group bacterium]